MTNRKLGPARRAEERKPATGKQPKPSWKRAQTKKDVCFALLSRREGASVADFEDATGWQMHTVRGFLSATAKKIPGMRLESVKSEGGLRRYHLRVAG